jgi:hypothetical protein
MNVFFLYRKAWRFDGAPHEEPRLQEQEWKQLLKQGGFLVRNTFGFDGPAETHFWYVIKDGFDDLEMLSSNTRRKVRRSLEQLEFNQIDIGMLRNEGYNILKATFDDHAVDDRLLTTKTYRDYLDSCEKQTYHYWGIFDRENGNLVGFCTVWLWHDACEIGKIAVMPTYKRHSSAYPYYGLFFSLCQHYLQRVGYRYITDGSRTITEHSQIHDFLIQNFHFRRAYCQLEVHYCWWMKIAVKMLYPFRKIISLPRIKAILNMEAMQRGEK